MALVQFGKDRFEPFFRRKIRWHWNYESYIDWNGTRRKNPGFLRKNSILEEKMRKMSCFLLVETSKFAAIDLKIVPKDAPPENTSPRITLPPFFLYPPFGLLIPRLIRSKHYKLKNVQIF